MESIVFSPATAVWNQRLAIQANRDRLQQLFTAVNDPESLSLPQWIHLYAAVLEFKPDLVLELGRHIGNSTAVFTEAANQIGQCQVISLCRTTNWQEATQQQVSQIVSPEWFNPLEARIGDILQTDTEALLANHQRVLVLWDAHGFDVAEYVLGSLMPLLQQRQHIVLVHDISDLRYCAGQEDYAGKPLWRSGSDDSYTDHNVRVVLGPFSSAVEQAIALIDFASRNHLILHSADESFYTELNPDQAQALQTELGDQMFSRNGHWVWFSLNEKEAQAPVYFPKFVSAANSKSAQPPPEVEQLQAEVTRLRNEIEAMQSSKFWKLRQAWFQLKQKIKFAIPHSHD